MGDFGIGQPLERLEDPRLLTGAGRFVGDRALPGQAHLVLVRSPHAHARIAALDTAAARAAPGVLGVFTAEDLRADGLGTSRVTLPRKRPDGSPMFWRAHAGLARERVRHVGDPVVAVVAETLAQAKDAADLVAIDYEALPAVAEAADALRPGAAAVWEECPDNVSHVFEAGDAAATEAAFARAAHVVRRRYAISRVHAQFLEPRGALGAWDAASGRYTLVIDSQYPHRVRDLLAHEILWVPPDRIRVVSEDVGGAFGAKGWASLEHRHVLWLARKLGRPVKWSCERSEAPLADEHGRDMRSEAELALDAGGRFLALRVRNVNNLGAYASTDRQLLPTFANLGSLVGMYAFGAAHVRVTGVFTHTSSTAPYRGSGRPEAIYVLERLVDDAARELGMDRIALRRRNLIAPAAMPYRTALTFTYDCGEFEQVMDEALALGDWQGFEARRAAAARRGKLRGIGMANAIERAAAGPGSESARIAFDAAGRPTLYLGTKSQGQSHETTFRQIAAEVLGIAPQDIDFVEGDTDRVAEGLGTFGSRSAALGGSALSLAAAQVVAHARELAAERLEAAGADLVFEQGRFRIAGTDRSVSLAQVAGAVALDERASFAPAQENFPNSCHVCEVEVDPETGEVSLASYAVVDDVGTVLNPLTLKGQVHGGVVQGLGQILMERMAYERDTGQLLTASFMDYAMPRAGDLCGIEVGNHPVPTALNPLGVKGAGEAGTVGALAACMNAVLDALAPRGVKDLEMPVTPEAVWRALRHSRGS
ncbi:MAG: xanthine dehydrogenase family protein molybdopterin-binding subunit [Betaproteobacteria bacterium]|nr:xanthine dehydrogenase family protein molybdopterin-binding subunit [Betaproteobacteria bacterium]MDH5219953.1 xanthine dehydrogenase family protein molybdopterin-binding subunit [Betaproteobacteria bacterium]MDH5350777.1 xanthine dehydrogenase family protein molybdopterin-binding subunit [Betaproteobacteria bacterium]